MPSGWLIRTFVLLCVFAAAIQVKAQDVLIPVVGGFNVHCSDAAGDAVYTRFVSGGGDAAWSTIEAHPPGAEPLIVINMPVVGRMPQLLQLFAYAHECGHHSSGDVMAGIIYHEIDPDREKTADRIGIRLLRDQFHISQQNADLIASFFQKNPPFPGYLPGPQRAQWIRNCYTSHNDDCTNHSATPRQAPGANETSDGSASDRSADGSSSGQSTDVALPVITHVSIWEPHHNEDNQQVAARILGGGGWMLKPISDLVASAGAGFSLDRDSADGTLIVTEGLAWGGQSHVGQLEGTTPISCLFSLEEQDSGTDLTPSYRAWQQIVHKALPDWSMTETTTTLRPGQVSGKVMETVFKHGTQTVSLHIYLDQGYYLNVQFFAPAS